MLRDVKKDENLVQHKQVINPDPAKSKLYSLFGDSPPLFSHFHSLDWD
jgi:hypothetical protein